jgi:hypothetical protein
MQLSCTCKMRLKISDALQCAAISSGIKCWESNVKPYCNDLATYQLNVYKYATMINITHVYTQPCKLITGDSLAASLMEPSLRLGL